MTERRGDFPIDPELAFELKGQLLELWDQLPPMHQVTVALVLVADVLDHTAYDGWLRGAIDLCRPEEARQSLDYPPL